MFQKLYTPKNIKAYIALFLSGSGSNVEQILDQEISLGKDCPYLTVLLVTDDKRSNAKIIGELYDVSCYEYDIRDFLEKKGLERKLTLSTKKHRQAREEYTEELREYIKKWDIDFAVFGGFEPLTNIAKYIPCINVHPGDLTYMKNGERYLVGLHTVPIQRALDENIGYVRSSVILAMPYSGDGKSEMDNGAILGLGPKLFYEDERDPKKIQNKLKEASDWKILPAVVNAVAKGEIEVDYKSNRVLNPVIMDDEYRISQMK